MTNHAFRTSGEHLLPVRVVSNLWLLFGRTWQLVAIDCIIETIIPSEVNHQGVLVP